MKNPKMHNGIGVNTIKEICENLDNIFFQVDFQFPARVSGEEFEEAIPRFLEFHNAHNGDVVMVKEFSAKRIGRILPYPRVERSLHHILTIIIEKIDIKDAGSYIDPFVQITVKDKKGASSSSSVQSSPISMEKTENSIIFNCEVHIQQSIENLSSDEAIYLELYHFKPKKGMNSLKCFSIIEKDEIKEGQLHLEIYKKPIDFKRKKLQLLDNNDRLMHVYLYVTSNKY